MTNQQLSNLTNDELANFTNFELGIVLAIFDRTQSDIDNKTAKGRMNYTDMNRVEVALKTICDVFSISFTQKTWVVGELPTHSDFVKWQTAMTSIKSKYDVLLPVEQTPYMTYQKWNAIEYFLYYTDLIYQQNELDKPYCGEFYCGEWGLI